MERAIKCTYGIGSRPTHHDILVFQNIVDDLEYTVHCRIEIDLFGMVSHQWRQELGIRSQTQFRPYFHIAQITSELFAKRQNHLEDRSRTSPPRLATP